MQYPRMQWDDLQYVLAVARTGSALRAARILEVNQTTVLRRLDALDAVVGAVIFERSRAGQTLTPAGRLVVEAAERMEREAQALQNALAAQQRSLEGSVRLTTSDSLANRLVTPCLRDFRARYPGIRVELMATDQRLDIARGEADVALRANSQPEGTGIVARRMPDSYWTVYCSRAYAAERGMPADRESFAGHDIVGMEGRMAELAGSRWLAASAPASAIRFRSNSLINLISNLKVGLGIGALPTLLGDAEPELVRCFPPPPELRGEMWLIVRDSIKDLPHVRAFTDFLACYVRETVTAADAAQSTPTSTIT